MEHEMATAQPMKSAEHRQTRYPQAPPLDPSVVLPQPELTTDLEQAKRDLVEFGMCLLRVDTVGQESAPPEVAAPSGVPADGSSDQTQQERCEAPACVVEP